MTTGTMVTITGAKQFAGRILVVTESAMIVAVASDRSVTLRRDFASTAPDQWRYAGLPVNVLPVPATDFAKRLAALEERTREVGQ